MWFLFKSDLRISKQENISKLSELRTLKKNDYIFNIIDQIMFQDQYSCKLPLSLILSYLIFYFNNFIFVRRIHLY